MADAARALTVPPIDTLLLRKNALTKRGPKITTVLSEMRVCWIEVNASEKSVICRFPIGIDVPAMSAAETKKAVENGLDFYDFYYRCDMTLCVNNSLQIDRIRRVSLQCGGVQINVYQKGEKSKFVYDGDKARFVLPLVPFGPQGTILIRETFSSDYLCIVFDQVSDGNVKPLQKSLCNGFSLCWSCCGLDIDAFVDCFYAGDERGEARKLSRGDFVGPIFALESMTPLDEKRVLIAIGGVKSETTRLELVQKRSVTLFNPDNYTSMRKWKTLDDVLACLVYANDLETICTGIPFKADADWVWDDFVMYSNPPCKTINIQKEKREQVERYLEECAVDHPECRCVFRPMQIDVEASKEEVAAAKKSDLQRAEFYYACFLFFQYGGDASKQKRHWLSTRTARPPLPASNDYIPVFAK